MDDGVVVKCVKVWCVLWLKVMWWLFLEEYCLSLYLRFGLMFFEWLCSGGSLKV